MAYGRLVSNRAARPGFEPRLKASKASVLPLDDRAIQIRTAYFSKKTTDR